MSTAEFFERRWVRDWPDSNAAARDAVAAIRERGATYLRLTMLPIGVIILEGWRRELGAPPPDEGELPL